MTGQSVSQMCTVCCICWPVRQRWTGHDAGRLVRAFCPGYQVATQGRVSCGAAATSGHCPHWLWNKQQHAQHTACDKLAGAVCWISTLHMLVTVSAAWHAIKRGGISPMQLVLSWQCYQNYNTDISLFFCAMPTQPALLPCSRDSDKHCVRPSPGAAHS